MVALSARGLILAALSAARANSGSPQRAWADSRIDEADCDV